VEGQWKDSIGERRERRKKEGPRKLPPIKKPAHQKKKSNVWGTASRLFSPGRWNRRIKHPGGYGWVGRGVTPLASTLWEYEMHRKKENMKVSHLANERLERVHSRG